MLISAHQCASVLISAFQCFSVLISAHQCSSARTSPCARQCRAGSAAARTRTPSGRCRGGEAMAETHVRMSRSSNQAQSSAIKRNQAQSSAIKGDRTCRGRGDDRDARHTLEKAHALQRGEAPSRSTSRDHVPVGRGGRRGEHLHAPRPVRRAEITYHPLARHGASELRVSGRDGLISGERDRVARGASDGHYGAIGR